MNGNRREKQTVIPNQKGVARQWGSSRSSRLRRLFLEGFLAMDLEERARRGHEERARRGHQVDLISCLQYGDKGWILSYEDIRMALSQESRKHARKAVKELETLRNHLAHTQEIIAVGWQRIVVACDRFEESLETIANRLTLLQQSAAQD